MARFVEAQTVWDRAMAEGLFDIQRSTPKAIAVGLMGHGHVQYGHGVAYQLASFGKTDVFSAIAVATTGVCSPEPDSADALYGAD